MLNEKRGDQLICLLCPRSMENVIEIEQSRKIRFAVKLEKLIEFPLSCCNKNSYIIEHVDIFKMLLTACVFVEMLLNLCA